MTTPAHPVTLRDLEIRTGTREMEGAERVATYRPAKVADLVSPEIRPLVVSALRAEGVLVVEKIDGEWPSSVSVSEGWYLYMSSALLALTTESNKNGGRPEGPGPHTPTLGERKEPVRDPERIDRVLEKLAIKWKQYPDLRLGQLICIANGQLRHPDPFGLEDSDLEGWLESEGLGS